MADDLRSPFPSLEGASGEGLVLREVKSGDSPTGKSGSIALGFRDSAGNLVLPQLTAEGKLPVDTEAITGTPLHNRAENADGSVSGTFVTLSVLTLTPDAIYEKIEYQMSGRRGGFFQLIQNDNGNLSVIDDVILDAPQLTFANKIDKRVTAGSTGTQELYIRAFNWDSNVNQLSPLRSSLRAREQDTT